jgi:hypothetical protein
MPFLVRLGTIGRSKDRFQWSPNDSHQSAFARQGNLSRNHTDPVPRRGQPYADSPPPYGQVQSVSRRQAAEATAPSASSRRGDERRSPQRAATAPLTSGNLASLDGDGVHFKNRLSHVSQYPTQLLDSSTAAPSSAASSAIGAEDFPPTPGRRPQRRASARRPASAASSSSTAAACMALGQLPGSEPFGLAPPSRDVLRRHSGVAALPSPPPGRSATSWLDDARGRETVYETAQAVPVRPVVSVYSRNASSTSVNRISAASTAPSLGELANAHEGGVGGGSAGKRLAGGFPRRLSSLHAHPVVRTSRTWPTARQAPRPERRDSLQIHASAVAAEPHPGHRVDIDDGEDRPPPPPPKDPGYVSRPPGKKAKQRRQASSQQQQQQQQKKRLRRHSSTPNLSSVGLGVTGVSLYSANDGELLLPNSQYSGGNKNTHARTPSALLGRRASARNRLGSLVQGVGRHGPGQQSGHRRFFSLRTGGGGGGEPVGDASFRERSEHDKSSPANRRSQMAVACARFLGRALPKSSVIKGS